MLKILKVKSRIFDIDVINLCSKSKVYDTQLAKERKLGFHYVQPPQKKEKYCCIE